jgi:hypothetical protein
MATHPPAKSPDWNAALIPVRIPIAVNEMVTILRSSAGYTTRDEYLPSCRHVPLEFLFVPDIIELELISNGDFIDRSTPGFHGWEYIIMTRHVA